MIEKSNRLIGILIACVLLAPAELLADLSVETQSMSLRFSDQGSLIEAYVCYPDCRSDSARHMRLSSDEGIVRFGQRLESRWVHRQGLETANSKESRGSQGRNSLAQGAHQHHFSDSSGQTITWIVPDSGYLLEARVGQAGESLATESRSLELRAGEVFKPRPAPGFGGWLEQVRYVGIGQDGVLQVGLDEEELTQLDVEWGGFRNRFWTALVSGDEETVFEILTGEENGEAVLRRPLNQASENFVFYLGPVEPTALAAADEMLEEMLYAGLWFWLRWICFGLFYLLGLIQSVIPVWGLAIMVLSVCVHVLMLPLSRIAERFQQQVNAIEARLAPELSRIKKEYRGEEQAAKIIALYKTERVHPLYSLKSMLGVAVVIPVFIGAFDMLAENIHLLNTGFLWIRDLSRPDAFASLPFSLPFFGSELNLLPFLMTGLSVAASAFHSPLALTPELRNKQVRNMLLLAVAFFVLFYTFPAGMVLYWTTNNLISVSKSLGKKVFTRGKT